MNPIVILAAVIGVFFILAAVPTDLPPARQQTWVKVKLCDSTGNQVGERIYNTVYIHWVEPTDNPNVIRGQFEDEVRFVCSTWDRVIKLTRTDRQ